MKDKHSRSKQSGSGMGGKKAMPNGQTANIGQGGTGQNPSQVLNERPVLGHGDLGDLPIGTWTDDPPDKKMKNHM